MNEELPIEQILKSIKHVILGKAKPEETSDDIYELTDSVSSSFEEEKDVCQNAAGDFISADLQQSQTSIRSDSIISNGASEEVKEHLANLKSCFNKSNRHQSKTVEELTADIMRPYLTIWLNENLPKIVKDLVEQEIKKLVLDEKNSNS